MSHGYDILTLSENGKEKYIEEKTTTRTQEDPESRKFFISLNEVEKHKEDPNSYIINRVYDIENEPIIEELNLDDGELSPDGYIKILKLFTTPCKNALKRILH